MKAVFMISLTIFALGLFPAVSHSVFWQNAKVLAPQQGALRIPVGDVSDGKVHFFKVKADDGTMVTFFVLKSRDGVIRVAIDACDVCYRSGKGYLQEGDFMVCEKCGRQFASDKINVITGGCNPVGVARTMQADRVVISMKEINPKSWYCQFKKQ